MSNALGLCECTSWVCIPGEGYLDPVDKPYAKIVWKLQHHPHCKKRPATQKYLKVAHDGANFTTPLTAEGMQSLMETMLDSEAGDIYEISMVEMKPDVYEKLPEFTGF